MPDLAQQPETGTGSIELDLTRRLVAEGIGTGFLVIAVIGSGIMAGRSSPPDAGLELLENAAAPAPALIGPILVFGAGSGAHLNPAGTPRDPPLGGLPTPAPALHIAAPVVGGCAGA